MPKGGLHAFVIAGVLAASIAGCGDDDREGSVKVEGGTGTETTGTGTTATTPAGDASSFFDISETEFRLKPATFRIGERGVVVFRVTNDGGVVHALEVEGPTGEFETEEIQPGGDATLKADLSKPGTYELYCPVGDHEQQGMTGKLVVGGGGSGADDRGDDKGDHDKRGSGGDEGHGGPGDSGSNDDGGHDDDTGGTAAPDY